MDQGKGMIAAGIIIAIALVYSVHVMSDAYICKSFPSSHSVTASLSTDLTKLENAIANQDREVMSLEEAARYLGIKEDYFSELFYGGKLDSLPYVTIGGTVVFSKKALDEWVADASASHVSIKP